MHNLFVKYYNKNLYHLFLILLMYYLLTTTIPFITQLSSPYLTLLVIIVLYSFIIISNPGQYIIFLGPLFCVAILDIFYELLYKNYNIVLFLYDKIIWLLPALIGYFIIKSNNIKIVKILIYVVFAGLVLTSITSIIGLIDDPMAARNIASISDSKSDYAINLNLRNIGGFNIVYMIVPIYPMVVCLYKYKKIQLLTFIFVSTCFTIYIYIAQYATATLLLAGCYISLLFKKNNNLKNMILSLILVLTMIFIFRDSLLSIFYYLSYNLLGITYSERFSYLADVISGLDTTMNPSRLRFEVYFLYSTEAIKKYPDIGYFLVNPNISDSGHSFVLDTIARYGLFGLSALIIYYKQILKLFYLPFKAQPFFGYMVFSFIVSFVLGIINPINSLFTIAFIIPLMGCIINGFPGRAC